MGAVEGKSPPTLDLGPCMRDHLPSEHRAIMQICCQLHPGIALNYLASRALLVLVYLHGDVEEQGF